MGGRKTLPCADSIRHATYKIKAVRPILFRPHCLFILFGQTERRSASSGTRGDRGDDCPDQSRRRYFTLPPDALGPCTDFRPLRSLQEWSALRHSRHRRHCSCRPSRPAAGWHRHQSIRYPLSVQAVQKSDRKPRFHSSRSPSVRRPSSDGWPYISVHWKLSGHRSLYLSGYYPRTYSSY